MTKTKLTPKQIELLRKLVLFPEGSARWLSLSPHECTCGTAMDRKGLAVWKYGGGSFGAGEKILVITDAGREALKEIGE